MISKDLLKKYQCAESVEKFKEDIGDSLEVELAFYQEFLKNTDYLALKLAEGLITREDKKAEFDARDFCRAEINRLQSEQTKVK